MVKLGTGLNLVTNKDSLEQEVRIGTGYKSVFGENGE
jgi:hypothetical protein